MKLNIFLLVLAGLGFAWLFYPMSGPETPKFILEKKPEEYMTGIFVESYTEEGKLKNQLAAKHWAYLPELKISKLTDPELLVYKPDKSVWEIKAKEGLIKQPSLSAIEEVELKHEVVLRRLAAANVVPLRLETSFLRYLPKTQYAETDAFISLSKPGLKITGTGLRAFLDKNAVELLSDVKTSYVPNS